MGIFKAFRMTEEDEVRVAACYEHIPQTLAQRGGIDGCIERDGWIAFAGSPENPSLQLSVGITESAGTKYLTASVDDEVSWYGWDFESADAFEDAIVDHLLPLLGRTVKTVTEKKKFQYIRIASYYLDEANEWMLISEETVNFPLLRLLLWTDSLREEIRSYRLESL